MGITSPRRTGHSVGMQTLEDRRLLVAFGTPWPDARELTISFPSDGVEVGRYQNDIEATLDEIAPRQQWHELALRAFQTWSLHADINIGLRNDHNVAMGIPGRMTQDPRFGEFRIGAFPQTGLLASSVPFQAIAGTYSGDLLLNSNESFHVHDWNQGLPPDPATFGPDDRDLFSLLLHEVGNTLGLADNQLDWTVMFGQYAGPKGALSPDDIAAIESLYGSRSDPYESSDNGQVQNASLIPTPVGLDPSSQVIRSRGSLLDGADVDNYRIVPIAGHDALTIRVRTSGISLVMSKLEILDEAGQVLQQSDAVSVFDNDVTLQMNDLQSHNAFYVRVSAMDPTDVYAAGDYLLEIDYRDSPVQATDVPRASYDAGPGNAMAQFDLSDADDAVGDSVADAVAVAATTLGDSTRFELESTVISHDDVDYWKVTSPSVVQGRLIIHLAGVGLDGPEWTVDVVDAGGASVGSRGRLRSDGTLALEVAQPNANQDYFIRVSVDPTSTVGVGQYVAIAEFQAPSAQMYHLATNHVSDDADDFIRWSASETKLFRFDLQASGALPDQAVRMTIYDAHTKQAQLIVVAHSGVTRSALTWLQEGEYIIRFTVLGNDLPAGTTMAYSVFADGISDDQADDMDTDGYGTGYYYYDYHEPPFETHYYYYDYGYGYGYGPYGNG